MKVILRIVHPGGIIHDLGVYLADYPGGYSRYSIIQDYLAVYPVDYIKKVQCNRLCAMQRSMLSLRSRCALYAPLVYLDYPAQNSEFCLDIAPGLSRFNYLGEILDYAG